MTALFMLCPTACGNAIWRRSTPWAAATIARRAKRRQNANDSFCGLAQPRRRKNGYIPHKERYGRGSDAKPVFCGLCAHLRRFCVHLFRNMPPLEKRGNWRNQTETKRKPNGNQGRTEAEPPPCLCLNPAATGRPEQPQNGGCCRFWLPFGYPTKQKRLKIN